MSAVFDQLSQGDKVTAGLKKVDPSQQTHKNPSLRAQAPVRSDSTSSTGSRGKSPNPPRKPESMRQKKPSKKALEGNKWLIENYDGPSEQVTIDAKLTHSILVTKCTNTTIRVNGKANAISIDSSSKVNIIIDSLVSAVDVIKTSKFALQVLQTVPTILLDQVDGATIYLSATSLDTETLTSRCTAVNIYVLGKTEEDDYSECPLPEQIRTVIKNGKARSEIVEHSS